MGIRTELTNMSGGWVFLLGVVGFIVWFYASDWLWDLLASFADWLVSIGGYGLSNVVFAALVLAGFVILAAGYPQVFIIGPVVGTTAVLAGRMEAAHARTMDARRGMPPAVAGPG